MSFVQAILLYIIGVMLILTALRAKDSEYKFVETAKGHILRKMYQSINICWYEIGFDDEDITDEIRAIQNENNIIHVGNRTFFYKNNEVYGYKSGIPVDVEIYKDEQGRHVLHIVDDRLERVDDPKIENRRKMKIVGYIIVWSVLVLSAVLNCI